MLFPSIETSSLIYILNLLNLVNIVMKLNEIFNVRLLAGVFLGPGQDPIRISLIFCLPLDAYSTSRPPIKNVIV